jgi:hypothetical protein
MFVGAEYVCLRRVSCLWAQSVVFVGADFHVCLRKVSCLWAQSVMFFCADYRVCGRRVSCLWAQSIMFVGAESHVCERRVSCLSEQSIVFMGAVSCLWAQSIMFVCEEYHVCLRRSSCLWAQSIIFVGAECHVRGRRVSSSRAHVYCRPHAPNHSTTNPTQYRQRQQTKQSSPLRLFQLPDSVATAQFISCDLIFSLKFH